MPRLGGLSNPRPSRAPKPLHTHLRQAATDAAQCHVQVLTRRHLVPQPVLQLRYPDDDGRGRGEPGHHGVPQEADEEAQAQNRRAELQKASDERGDQDEAEVRGGAERVLGREIPRLEKVRALGSREDAAESGREQQ